MTRYVQHNRALNATKWALVTTADHTESWCVHNGNGAQYRLPKSEYELVEVPEVWQDVTETCVAGTDGFIRNTASDVLICRVERGGYRFRKVEISVHDHSPNAPLVPTVWAFVVERREP